VVYEGYGPGGTAIYVEALTDNRNRTVGEVRHVLTKHGGNLGANGCVAYLFEKKGVATVRRRARRSRRAHGGRARARRDDVVESGSSIEVVTAPGRSAPWSRRSREGLRARRELDHDGGEHEGEPRGRHAETMLRVADALEDLDDVQNVYANFDISDEEMQRIAG
jgi:transcriptional/translational regulatory protein YebC/TACO1